MPFKLSPIHQCIILCGVITFPLLQVFNPRYLKAAVFAFMLTFLLASANQLNLKGLIKFLPPRFLKFIENYVQQNRINSFFEDQSEGNVETRQTQFSLLSLNSTKNKSTLKERSKQHMAPEKKMPYQNTSLNFKDNSTQQLISSSTYDPSLIQVHNDILPEGSGLEFKPTVSDIVSNDVKNLTQPFQYYLCFDVEATCEQGGGFDYKNEIIEFPVLLIESKTFNVVDVFHSYVKPSNNPVLSKFCIELTGIPQSTIDISPSFPEVLCRFQDFLYSHKLFIDNSCAFLTDGPWDIRDFITKQCKVSKIPRPKYFSVPWVDVRTMFAKFYNCRPRNIPNMLAHYGLKFDGHEHSGIDDAKNLAIIAKRLWEDGAVFRTNRRLQR